jgi:7-keto-8-aminopelargonate synthetase-like enzyme
VIGSHGRGLSAELHVSDDVDVQMGTLSKALGVSGGYICGSRSLIQWLINRARSFVYSTAPPASIAAAALAAVDFVSSSQGEERRLLLWERIRLIRKILSPLTSHTSSKAESSSAILPVMVGNEQAALDFAATLKNHGFLVPAIRYPTVAKGSARLRITVTAAHTEDQILSLAEAIQRFGK